jgi:hypothetical protein
MQVKSNHNSITLHNDKDDCRKSWIIMSFGDGGLTNSTPKYTSIIIEIFVAQKLAFKQDIS